MIEPNPNVLKDLARKYDPRRYRPRRFHPRTYHPRQMTEAQRAALRENLYKTTIAGKGLQDSPEVRFLYKSCPEAFLDWTIREGQVVPNEITPTHLKLIVAVLKAQQLAAHPVQQIKSIPAPRPKRKPGRPASIPLSAIWAERKDEFEPMLLTAQAELSKKLHAELRARGHKIGTAKKVRDFIRYRVTTVKKRNA